MVESVGAKPVIGGRKVVAIARAAAAPPATTIATPSDAKPATAAAQLAARPPLDLERVERIKRAIADGKFPLSPATIADRLIALRYEWMADDPA